MSKNRFGYEWGTYSNIYPEHEQQFLNWISPYTPNDFIDKEILDVGCGIGRNSYFALKYGAKFVTAIDSDRGSIHSTKKNLSKFKNSKTILMDIYDLHYEYKFDLIFSIGVLHHLEKPKQALKKMMHALKPGGVLVLWVYSFEGNTWIEKYISPIREKFLSKLPISFLNYITYLVSIPFYLSIKITTPTNAYIEQISHFSFFHIHQIIFDQFLPEVANYWTKEEVLLLVNDLHLSNVLIKSPPNKMGWTIIGKKISNNS